MLRKHLRLYYFAKFLIPRRLQIALRRKLIRHQLPKVADIWPIHEGAAAPPEGWTGWPDGKRFAFVLTHDVESRRGLDRVLRVADLEESLGFRSSFNFVAEDYDVPESLRRELTERGFEVGVHGLTHDGSLYHSRASFTKQAARINRVLKEWNAVGFRSPSMHHNLEWLHDLDIVYDSSTFDTDPFEPQPDSLHSIFPVWLNDGARGRGYVELPYTLPQDYTVFILMQEPSIEIWRRKLHWIAERGGLGLLNSHPDYMCFGPGKPALDEYPVARYRSFLDHLRSRFDGHYWHVLPRDLADFWMRATTNGMEKVLGAYPISEASVPADSMEPAISDCSADVDQPHPTPQSRSLPVNAGPRRIPARDVSPSTSSGPGAGKPLRVCMVAYTFYDADNRVKRYAESLQRRGDQVDVIALRREGQSPFGIDKGVRVYRIQQRVVNEKGKRAYLYRILAFLLRSFAFLTSRHVRCPYDLVHVHNVPDFEVFAAIVPKLMGAKLILDIHDILPEFYASKFDGRGDRTIFNVLKRLEKLSCAFADHVIVSNDLWRERLIERSVHASKCTTILNYPDGAIFRAAPEPRVENGFTLLYPGTLNRHQGVDVAVKAFALVKERLPEACFHIYGEGPETENLQRLAENLGLLDRVIFHPVVPIEEIVRVMQAADLGVVPKRARGFGGEAFSTKILEFMALGVPVVASDTRIDRYYFNDSLVRFFRSEDERDLAEAIVALARDDSARRRLAENGLRLAHEYTWDTKVQGYLHLVDRLVGSR